jgi:hypothetical protein
MENSKIPEKINVNTPTEKEVEEGHSWDGKKLKRTHDQTPHTHKTTSNTKDNNAAAGHNGRKNSWSFLDIIFDRSQHK